MDKTVGYYNDKAQEFFESTVNVDMSEHYRVFLNLLPPGGRILDAGCGSGRDSFHFINLGFQVTAIDASPVLAELSSKLMGQPVAVLRFQDLDFEKEFDGIWACASLLHVPRREMHDVLSRLTKALKPNGMLYASFKYGDGEGERNGRFFNDYNEQSFGCLLSDHPSLRLVSSWVSGDVRPERAGEKWLNVVVRRIENT
jgi:SAM-dependent methyltransferase